MKKYQARAMMEKIDRDALAPYEPVLQELLFGRGITDMATADAFLYPDYTKHMHDPYLLKDMGKAVERILKAFASGEQIAIFSDYDADGIPGAVVLSDFFKKIDYTNYVVYIPHRNDEGYGMNVEALEKLASKGTKKAKKQGAGLVITIDCGISNHTEVARANELGMDVIVTDHHLPKDTLPDAYAVINPKRADCTYPDKDLCGSGVIWKLISAIIRHPDFKKLYTVQEGYEKWLLDMVGLATLSDMVPLTGENRVIASYGLLVMRKSPRPGLHKLFSILKMRQNDITEDDISFLITPRINAASRMGHPKEAFDMLSSTDPVEAGVLAEHLNAINDERKGVVGSMVREIKKTISDRADVLRNVIVLGNPEWKPSLLGLVANSFSDEHNRPVFLWGRGEGNGLAVAPGGEGEAIAVLKGSCRSGGDVNIFHLMEHAKDIFLEYGGHKQAGGFSIAQENIHLLEGRLNDAFDALSKVEDVDSALLVDKVLSVTDVDWRLYGHIEKLAPFGMNNPKPLFLFENAVIVSTKQFGKEKNHLEIMFTRGGGKPLQAIAFFSGPEKFSTALKAGDKINLIAHVEKSTFRNFPELRLRIVDIL